MTDADGYLSFITATDSDMINRDDILSGNRLLKAQNIDDIVIIGLTENNYHLDEA
jgi:hypothetical protein